MKNQKQLFSLQKDIHYLNCAFKAPLLKSVEAAAIKALQTDRNPIGIQPKDFFSRPKKVRKEFGKLVNCEAERVAIIPSVSYGLATALHNIKCKKGKHAITIENEFPSGYLSLKKWCETHHATLKVINSDSKKELKGKTWNKDILKSINEETAVVVLSSVHWMNGIKFDLEKIGQKCRSVGAKFIIDGTQSVGALPIDVQKCNIDVLVCASYKWLLGSYSLALAHFGEHFDNGTPLEESWTNRTNAENFTELTNYAENYQQKAARYNVGESSSFILMPMLHTALKQINTWTPSEIQAYAGKLTEPLFEYLENLGVRQEPKSYQANHLFGLKLPTDIDMELLKENLVKHNIYLSVRGAYLRVAVNIFNTKQDISKLIEVIEMTRNGNRN